MHVENQITNMLNSISMLAWGYF